MYELTDHLGNVLSTVSDRKIAIDDDADNIINYYLADITNSTDFYAFGSIMPKRSGAFNSTYRFGFNGMEMDDEVKGVQGSDYDFSGYGYDARIARRKGVDPEANKRPSHSTYSAYGNNPLIFIDPTGRKYVIHYTDNSGNPQKVDYIPGSNPPNNDPFVVAVYETIDFLTENGLGGGIIEKIINSSIPVNVVETKSIRDFYYDTGTNTIYYNPTSGLKFSGGGRQSPAIGFLHESGHGYKDIFILPLYMAMYQFLTGTPAPPGFDYETVAQEEQRIIKTIETPAASAVGQGTRILHSEGSVFRVAAVEGPTSTVSQKSINKAARQARRQARRSGSGRHKTVRFL